MMNLEHVEGHLLLDELKDQILRYVALPSEAHADAITLWIATTHCLEAFEYAPRLVVRSPEKRSGKSRLLEVVADTCHKPLRAVNATVAAIFRSLDGDQPPTLLLDEADTIFGSRKVAENNEDLRGLLNAGFQRGLPVLRTVGPQHEPVEFPTFAMAALAGIGSMPDTIEDRAIVVVMRRRKPSEHVQPYRIRRDQPGLHQLRHRLADWAQTVIPQLHDAYPDMPVEDRAADTWEPLVAVADAAGGHWPNTAREAAVSLTQDAAESANDDSVNLRLLEDIKAIFMEDGPFIPSQTLCDRLHQVEESPWKDWDLNPSRLGRRLREYGIKTGRDASGNMRGYRLEDFQDSFDRYTRPKVSEGVSSASLQRKPSDTLGSSDALKVSDTQKASDAKPRDTNENRLLTPSDALVAQNLGKVVGNHPKFGAITVKRSMGELVLRPVSQAAWNQWNKDGSPDLAADLVEVAA